MNKYLRIIFTFAAATLSLCCSKAPHASDTSSETEPLRFGAQIAGVADTKAAETTSLESFHVSAARESMGVQSRVWTNVTFTRETGSDPAVYSAGLFWPVQDPGYLFAASSEPLSFSESGPLVSASASRDVVCAYLPSPVYKSRNTLVFNHVFARLCRVTVAAEEGYAISDVDIRFTPLVSGTYNLCSGAGLTDGTGWSDTVEGAVEHVSTSVPGTKENDIFLVPGTYELTLSFRAERGDYAQRFFNLTRRVDLSAGMKNHLHVTLGGNAEELSFSVSLTPWGEHTERRVFFSPKPFSVSATKSVIFSPGNLQAVIGSGPTDTYNYAASSWRFADEQYDYIGNTSGNNSFSVGTTVDLFGWVGESASYDTYGLCTDTGSTAAYYGSSSTDLLKTDWGSVPAFVSVYGSGWRTLSSSEWNYLFTGRSEASSKYGHCRIKNEDGTYVNGMLILPDDWNAPAGFSFAAGTGAYNRTTFDASAASGTPNAWCDVDEAGAVFLPAGGWRDGRKITNAGTYGYYWSDTRYNSNSSNRIRIGEEASVHFSYSSRWNGFSVRLVKDLN